MMTKAVAVVVVFAVSASAFVPATQKRRRNALGSSFSMQESSSINHIQNLLDEAVSLCQLTAEEHLPSQQDAEVLVKDVSKALTCLLKQDITNQLDQAVMEAASHQKVESLALQFHELQKQDASPEVPTDTLTRRLEDLKELATIHRSISLDDTDETTSTNDETEGAPPVTQATPASPSMEQNRIRGILDEAVSLCRSTSYRQLRMDAENLVCDASRALNTAMIRDISSRLDRAVMDASHGSSSSVLVESLAQQYHALHQRGVSEATPDALAERLAKLKQAVEKHESLKKSSTDGPFSFLGSILSLIFKFVSDKVTSLSGEEKKSNVEEHQDYLKKVAAKYRSSLHAFSEASSNSQQQPFSSLLSSNPVISSIFKFVSDKMNSLSNEKSNEEERIDYDEEVDIAIVGAGLGGLCAGAILNTLYGKKVGIYESHYLPGGCAHAFDRKSPSVGIDFTFDSGPTIVLGCSAPPYNPLRQVLNAIGKEVEWIRYDGWGMIEHPCRANEQRWKVELGPDVFEQGPLLTFGGKEAQQEFQELREATKGLVSGAVEIPAMAMRPGNAALIPLLRYFPALIEIIKQGELTTGTFAPYMDGPLFEVKNLWFRSWLDALAFSLSGLPASRTSAAAMAYVLFDMHRSGAALDYPKGGLGKVVDAIVEGVEQGSNGSKVHLRQHVESIDTTSDGNRITGLTLRNGKKIKAREGVICNAPVWSLNGLIKNDGARRRLDNFLPDNVKREPRKTWKVTENGNYIPPLRQEFEAEDSFLFDTDTAEQTGSFLHLHLAIKSDGLKLDEMEAHYTVMDRSLAGGNATNDGPCGELNMIAVSNPCVIDRSLAPDGYMVLHAYGAGNEPYDLWKDLERNSEEYKKLKEERAEVLWRAVESIIPDVRDRVVLDLIGSPLTHERFLRRPNGTYGSATEDYLKDGSTPIQSLVLANDGIFPGIGIPAVALSGASAANAFVSPWQQWKCLDTLKEDGLI